MQGAQEELRLRAVEGGVWKGGGVGQGLCFVEYKMACIQECGQVSILNGPLSIGIMYFAVARSVYCAAWRAYSVRGAM